MGHFENICPHHVQIRSGGPELYAKDSFIDQKLEKRCGPSKSERIGKIGCGLCCRAVCITRNFLKSQNPQLINKSGFKS